MSYLTALAENGKAIIVKQQPFHMICYLSGEYGGKGLYGGGSFGSDDLSHKDGEGYTLRKYDHITGELREAFRAQRDIAFKAIPAELKHKAEAMSILEDAAWQKDIANKSIPVEDLIAHLSKLEPGTRVVVQEAGHYAESNAITFDMHDLVEINGVQYHTLGASVQFC